MERDRYCAKNVTLETCKAVQLHFGENRMRSVVVWKGKPSIVRPVEKRKRIRDLKEGDEVMIEGERLRTEAIEIYR